MCTCSTRKGYAFAAWVILIGIERESLADIPVGDARWCHLCTDITEATCGLAMTAITARPKASGQRVTFNKATPVSGIKTQREIISEKLSKPKVKRNMYREFIEALNEVKKRDLISAERWREINQKWRDDEDEREELLAMLQELLNPES